MVKAQRDFAYECIEWGEKNYGMGHTLAALAWMESSLGADNEHDENSYGPFGISQITAKGMVKGSLQPKFSSYINRNLERNFEFAGRFAILIYLDNIRYIRQWHRNRGLTISDRTAWQIAAQVWPGGTNWQNREEYGRVFRLRVAFLRKLTKGVE